MKHCIICNKYLPTPNFHRHLQQHEGRHQMQCKQCQAIVSRAHISRHMKTHKPECTTKECIVCKKAISIPNFKRHQEQHDGQHRTKCPDCGATVSRTRWSKHLKTSAHALSVQAAAIEQEKLQSGHSIWEEFLATSNGPLLPLLNAYASEIKRVGGLSQLQSEKATCWNSIDLRAPLLFPASECWVQTPPSRNEYLDDLLCGYDERCNIYRCGSPHEPIEGSPISTVLNQLQQPDINATLYATNLISLRSRIKVPEWLDREVYENSHEVTTNITPKFSTVDLHIGMYTYTRRLKKLF
ncbi:hypothetical protein F4808DRAFT_70556 [Astrocystis sublimbata]|nr:hypothetical protein F4808DRAFT_70556 [Astrocystis sublimbata]